MDRTSRSRFGLIGFFASIVLAAPGQCQEKEGPGMAKGGEKRVLATAAQAVRESQRCITKLDGELTKLRQQITALPKVRQGATYAEATKPMLETFDRMKEWLAESEAVLKDRRTPDVESMREILRMINIRLDGMSTLDKHHADYERKKKEVEARLKGVSDAYLNLEKEIIKFRKLMNTRWKLLDIELRVWWIDGGLEELENLIKQLQNLDDKIKDIKRISVPGDPIA
jgi:hypothetical protein